MLDYPDCPCAGLYDGWEKHRELCDFCTALPAGFSSIRSAFPYYGVVGDVVRNLKYRGCESAAPALAGLLLAALRPHFEMLLGHKGVDLVVPVPLHPWRQWQRGFNQSERIAAPLGEMLGLPVDGSVVVRRKATPRQARKPSPAERLENVREAFALAEGADVAGRRIVLIDDVLTTGATAASCAAVLRDAGADAVHVVTVAAAGPRKAVEPEKEMLGLESDACVDDAVATMKDR